MAKDTELTWNGDKIIKNVNAGTIKALIKSANKVQADAKLRVRKDTTNLEGSIVVSKKYLSRYTIMVLTDSKYAFAQEFGRPDLKEYGFTPYMRPSLKSNEGYIERTFIEEERKAIDK